MATIKIIDPVTRLEGHLKIKITVDTVQGRQQVVDANATGTMFRGFEKILVGRSPSDTQHLTQRICGVCPVPHGMASVMAQELALNVKPPDNARIMRNLVMASNFIQSHILHFYHLAVQDFVDGPAMAPWQPSWNTDVPITGSGAINLVNHYVTAIDMTRKAHEMGALFGGRMPHPVSYIPGGFTTTSRPERISKIKSYLAELNSFITGTYLPDVDYVSSMYNDYNSIGRGFGNLLAFGVFDLDLNGTNRLLKRGLVVNGSSTIKTVDVAKIAEQVTYSWYADNTNNLNPSVGTTVPTHPKNNAYSWLKAPRYSGLPYETGPLARMWVNGDYRKGISVMDRHKARAQETQKIAIACQSWINQLQANAPVFTPHSPLISGTGVGLTEAPRGALGHRLQASGGKVSRYQIVTPTCWNASPRDSSGKLGPIEKALIGIRVRNMDEPVEVLRVIHSFDPCLSCAVHVVRPAEGKKIYAISDLKHG